jgi:concanavalin A-like lectin/glucanase superfamily protein
MLSHSVSLRRRFGALAASAAVALGLVVLTQAGPGVPIAAPLPASAPDSGTASVIAKQANRSVLVDSATTETAETMANPDGTFSVTKHLEPIRVRRDGKWVSADSRLSKRPDGSWASNAVLGATTLSGARKGAGAPLLQLSTDGMATGLDWLGDLPEPVVTGSTATYSEVLPGVDLKVESGVDTAYEVVVVKTPEAATNLTKLTMGLPVHGLTVTKAGDGSLHARNAKGEDVFTAKAPKMWDSSGVTPADTDFVRGPAAGGRTAAVATTLNRDMITLEPDANLLRAKDAVFPLYVDPTWQPNYCGGCGRNHYLVQYACGSGKTPGFTEWDSDDQLRVGFIGDGTSSCAEHLVTARSYVEMNLGGLAGKEIISSSLNLAVNNSKSCSGSNNVHLITSPIYNGQAFGAGPTTGPWLGFVSGCPTNVGYDVTGTVDDVVQSGSGTITFGILSPNENDINTWKRYSTQVGFTVTYNSAPNPIRSLQLYNGTRAYPCAEGANRPVVGKTSTSYIGKANVSDPDGGMLYAGFRIYRGATSSGNYQWDGLESGMDNVPSDGNPAHQNAQANLHNETLGKDGIYSVDVHVTDGRDTGWVRPCEFELELSAPTAPTIVSDSYPADGWGGGPGQAGHFTFSVPSSPTSIDHYVWKLDNTANPSCNGTELGSTPAKTFNGPGIATVAPPSKGTHVLSVWSCNRAQTGSTRVDYRFNVNDATTPVASWQFEGGLTSVNSGTRYAGEGLGIFADGKVGDAVTLSGQNGDYLVSSAKVLACSQSFSVSAWANLKDTATQHVVLSQDGVTRSVFALRYDKTLGTWAFGGPTGDTADAPSVAAVATAPPAVGTWTHLIGVYDATAHTYTLYVNGQAQQTVSATSWAGQGQLVIGAAKLNGARTSLYAGGVDEVATFGRALTAAEVATLTANNGVPTGLSASREYKLDDDTTDATGTEGTLQRQGTTAFGAGYSDSAGTSATERATGQGAGQGLVLAKSGYVQTAGPLIDNTKSFTVSAWAKLADTNGVYSIAGVDGTRASGFQLRYAPDVKKWIMGISAADADNENYRWAQSTSVPQANVWTHLTGVYDATAGKVVLYVNGLKESEALVAAGTTWQALGAFTVGRALATGGPTGSFNGSLDQVQVWDRALAGPEIAGLANTAVTQSNYQLSNGDSTNVPPANAAWNLDETSGTTAADSSGSDATVTLTGGATWATGKTGGALQLDGTGYGDAAGPVIDSSHSFAVSAWVKLADTNASYAVAGVDGVHSSGFVLGYSVDAKRWALGISGADVEGDAFRWAAGTSTPQAGVWTHVTGAYDADAGVAQLYVNGALESQVVIPAGTAWRATGPFEIGRYRYNGLPGSPYNGAIDQVRVFGQAVTADQAASLAGTTRDKVTGAVGVLSGQVSLTKDSGVNVAKFDKSAMGQISFPRPQNLRTDGSYTVEAWVKHTWTQADAQANTANNGVDMPGRAAVGVDDPAFSPFLLGYRGIKDANGVWQGRWSWLLMGANSTISNPQGWAMVGTENAQDNTWTHLTGTYDAVTRTACLYATTDSKQFTPACTSGVVVGWNGANPAEDLLIGRAQYTGVKSDWWYGPVRGVRVYDGVLDAQQISADALVDHP